MAKKKTKTYNDILLEIGTEPLPAGSIYSIIKQLKENTERYLKENNIVFSDIQTFDTLRRLVIWIKNVKDIQEPPAYEVRGPAKEIAFDENNMPTKAFYGFLNKMGLKQINVKIKKTKQGEYLFGLKKQPAKKVKFVLLKILRQIVDSLKCHKNMSWGKNYIFIRPIRWILALYKDKKINFEIAGVKSDNFTYGHQILSLKKFKIKNASDYLKKLNKNYVIVDFHKRKKRIEAGLKKLAKNKGLEVFEDAQLLDELCNLVEYPTFLVGTFNRKYLALPDEVIMTSLKKGQKLFALVDKKNKVSNNFLAVLNNKVSDSVKKNICSNYESILDAKLKDSDFFLRQDTKTPLSDKIELLKGLIFQKDLGSIYDKTERLRALSSYISRKLNFSPLRKKQVDRCALLCKADLSSQMVLEFPNLEGLIGSKYALISGEDKEVAKGIYEHYKPKSADDAVPESLTGAVLSISDKIDTLCACFSINLIPSGSYDPYALRRNALGLVRIILEKRLPLPIDELVDENLRLLKKIKPKIDNEKTKYQVMDFIKQRLRQILHETAKKEDLVEAVLSSNCSDLIDVVERIEQLEKISKSKKFFEAHKVVERTNNILKGVPGELPGVKTRFFKEDLEEKLFKIYNDNKNKILELIESRKYKEATQLYAEVFFEPLHVFFDKIMVNVDNKKIRNNRLSLMKLINSIYTDKVADLSVINF